MWIFILQIILFYAWPALAALACWVAWRTFQRADFRKVTFWMLGVEGVWMGTVFVLGIFYDR